MSGLPARFVLVVILAVNFTFLAGCTTHSALLTPEWVDRTVGVSNADLQNVEASISPAIQGTERKLIRSAMLQAAPAMRRRFGPRTRFILIFPSSNGDKIYVNNPHLRGAVEKLALVPGSSNLYADSSGHIAAFPGLPYNRTPGLVTAPLAKPNPSPSPTSTPYIPVQTQEGPYRRVISTTGYNQVVIPVQLPCGNTIAAGDTAYYYIGGFSPKWTNEVEAGLQYSPTYQQYTPYMKFQWTGNTVYELQSHNANYDGLIESGPADWNWHCSNQTETNLELQFEVQEYCTNTGYGGPCLQNSQPPYYTSFWLYTWPVNTSQDALILEVVFQGYPYPASNSWSQPCLNCALQRIMSIAQNGDNFTSGSMFGPLTEQTAGLGTSCTYCGELEGYWTQTTTLGCQNYPAWLSSDQTYECYNGPPSGATYKLITVSNFNWSLGASETITISTK